MLRCLSHVFMSAGLLLCSIKAASNYSTAVLSDHPVVYYRLGEANPAVAVDSSGNGHSALYVGGVVLGQSGAIDVDNDTSVGFDGSTGYVNCAFDPFSASGATVEAWIRPTRASAPPYPTTQQLIAGILGSTALTFGRTPGYATAWIWPTSGRNGGSATSPGDWKGVQTAAPLAMNTWTYLVQTWDDTTKQLSIYVNGTLSATAPQPGITAGEQLGTYPLTIGGFGNLGYEQRFQGGIDEVAYYNRALSPQQILAHYNAAKGILVRSGILSHIAAGGGWNTTITLVNTSSVPVTARLVFRADNGGALSLPLVTRQQGVSQTVTTTQLDRVINPNTTLLIDSGDQMSSTVVGWAEVLTSGPLGGLAIFRSTPQNGSPSEGTVPLQSQNPSTMTLPFDNSAGFVMGVALVNLSAGFANITATIWDDSGNQLGTQAIPLVGDGHMAFVLPTQLPLSTGKRGIVQFQSTAAEGIAGLGLRFSPFGTFTSVPAILSQ